MNINFDDYKISITDNEKDSFNYQCTPCNKKFRNKMQVIDVSCFLFKLNSSAKSFL